MAAAWLTSREPHGWLNTAQGKGVLDGSDHIFFSAAESLAIGCEMMFEQKLVDSSFNRELRDTPCRFANFRSAGGGRRVPDAFVVKLRRAPLECLPLSASSLSSFDSRRCPVTAGASSADVFSAAFAQLS